MFKKYSVIILILLVIALISGCVSPRYSGRGQVPPNPPAGEVVVNAPLPPASEKPEPPPWAPAHGHRAKYQYRYYPSSEIYFDTGRGLYFYYRNGSWSASATLPGGIRLSVNDYVTIELDSDRPYINHSEVKKKYPPGQMKKMKKEKKKGKYKSRDKYEAGYNYRYYPSNEIYFDTGRGLYFYYRNGSWSASATLPGGVRLSVDDNVTIELGSDKPYTSHTEIKKKYPPGKVKKMKKDKGKYKDRYDDEDD